ncbi:MAG: DsbC family protein [Burkholderiales bacterium]|nr:DsbC family protein [Burkholderiales bacterium]
MMLTKWIAGMALASLIVSGGAQADEASVKKLLEERLPELPVQQLKRAPTPGWYEVFSGDKLFYVDEKADYVFVGSIIDARSKRNLTEERIRDLMRVKFDALPFADAIKIVKGDGSRKIAVFEDPDCPFCKQVEANLAQLNNYTLYVFLYPIEQLHADAVNKSKKVWCAKDRPKAWLDLMLKNQAPQNKGDCANPVARNIELAGQLRIGGTPAVIFEDGRLVPGAIPKEQIEKFMSEATARKTEAKTKDNSK